QNNKNVLPIKLQADAHIYILTPWLEQGAGIAAEIARLQEAGQLPRQIQVTFAKMSETDLATEKSKIDKANIVIVGNMTNRSLPITMQAKSGFRNLFSRYHERSSLVFPEIPYGDNITIDSRDDQLSMQNKSNLSDGKFAYQALQYAKAQGKKTVFLSLLAPYDLPSYRDVADVMLAGYDMYGYLVNEHGQGYYRGPSMPALTRIIFGVSTAKAKLPIHVPNPAYPGEIVYWRGENSQG
ncbi:MAG TPA: hypothetical protein VHZ76_07115, partial [Gammaproteobacteria bacterium]|nr:hypothetical protein [Gammaproteobacteria bacterium]